MSEEWIFHCWDYRDNVAASANDEHLVIMHVVVFVANVFQFDLGCNVNSNKLLSGICSMICDILLLVCGKMFNVFRCSTNSHHSRMRSSAFSASPRKRCGTWRK